MLHDDAASPATAVTAAAAAASLLLHMFDLFIYDAQCERVRR